jgi:RNA polymerase sigma factor (sigma-70 family)
MFEENPNFKRTSEINPEDHLGLVYIYAKKAAYKYGGETEEWIGPTFEALLDAIRTYRPEKAKFSTHAVHTIMWKTYMYYMGVVLGKQKTYTGFKDRPGNLSDVVLRNLFARESTGDNEKPWIPDLTEKQQAVLSLLQRGKTKREISRIVGCTHQNVQNTIKNIQKSILSHLSNIPAGELLQLPLWLRKLTEDLVLSYDE